MVSEMASLDSMNLRIRFVSVVIPVFNEEGSLETLYQELVRISSALQDIKFEYIFVDDGSRDTSLSLLKALATDDSRVRVISFLRNFGQTAAISCGIKQAAGDVIIPMDADLQNDPADIPIFLEKIREGYSCVSGWRKDRKDDLFFRKIPSWIANAMISGFTGVPLHDYGCTMKAYRRENIQDIQLYGEMHRFIPVYATWSGAKVAEIVVNHRVRKFGESKYGLSRIFKVMLDLLVVKFLAKYFNKPIHFFGAIGFGAFFIGTVAILAAIAYKLSGLKDFVETPLPVLGAMCIIVGVQFILFGMLSEVLMRTYYESKGSQPYTIRDTFGISPNKLDQS